MSPFEHSFIMVKMRECSIPRTIVHIGDRGSEASIEKLGLKENKKQQLDHRPR